MKKLLLILLMFLSVNVYSQTFYTNYLSTKSLIAKDKWTDWSDWESCYHKIVIDLDSNTIVINVITVATIASIATTIKTIVSFSIIII